jgi:hypothetical protein
VEFSSRCEGVVKNEFNFISRIDTPPTDKMKYIYIVFENTTEDRRIHDITYKTYEDACNAIKERWIGFLEEDRETNDMEETAEEMWLQTLKEAEVVKNITHLYIEKENFFEIHKLPLPE